MRHSSSQTRRWKGVPSSPKERSNVRRSPARYSVSCARTSRKSPSSRSQSGSGASPTMWRPVRASPFETSSRSPRGLGNRLKYVVSEIVIVRLIVKALPKVHGRISPPRTPRRGRRAQGARRRRARRFQEAKVARGEGVRPTQGAKGDVLGRPLADSRILLELADDRLRIGAGFEDDPLGDHRPR